MSTDKITILIDGAEQTVPEMNDSLLCPDHLQVEPEIGFGLAGGEYGAYTYCPECGRVLSKTQDHGDA